MAHSCLGKRKPGNVSQTPSNHDSQISKLDPDLGAFNPTHMRLKLALIGCERGHVTLLQANELHWCEVIACVKDMLYRQYQLPSHGIFNQSS